MHEVFPRRFISDSLPLQDEALEALFLLSPSAICAD